MRKLTNENIQRFVGGRMMIVHDQKSIHSANHSTSDELGLWDGIVDCTKIKSGVLFTKLRFVTEYGPGESYKIIKTPDYINNQIQLNNFNQKPSSSPKSLWLLSNCGTVLIALYEPDQTFTP